jgi:predicted nucleic acid-binding protein
MTTTTDIALPNWTEELKHSEALDALMVMAGTMYELNAEFGDFLKIHVIVDTNIIVGDLLAILRKQSVGKRRPAIMELLAKGTLIGYFPHEKLQEVHEKCIEISERYSIKLPDVLALWKKYQQHLRIVPTGDLELERSDSQALATRDPTDLPFVQARHIVGASVVLSNDPDLKASGAPVMPWSQILLDLRHHARHEGLKAALFIGGGTAIVVPMIALVGCVKMIYKACKSIPPKALLIAAAGFGVALLIPQSRKFLIEAGKSALDAIKKIGAAVGPVLGEAYEAGARAEARAKEMRPALEKKLAEALRKRLTLTQAVYRVCLIARKPLTVTEVWAAAARDGTKSNAKQPLKSVLRALKRHPLLTVLPDRRWQALTDVTNSSA